MQSAAKPAADVPGQVANSAYARSPAASRSVTRCPDVSTACQWFPASCVAHSSGPNAHPFTPSRNRIPLTPFAPLGAPATGACSPCQVLPPSDVHATDVQMLPL